MPVKDSLRARLRKAGIRHFDELIHDQPKEWLIKNFSKRADEYPVNTALLMRNIVWQMRERIISKEKEPFTELLRTFWYAYIKPTLARAEALGQGRDQYKDLSANIVYMVKDIDVMRYKDIGFRDDRQGQRMVGGSANIILFSEKAGHQDFLIDIAKKYSVSAIALGGQPSVLNTEYFVNDLKKKKVNLKRSFYLFSIVDYDPSGWIIRDAFLNNLKFYGLSHTRTIELIHPDMLTTDEIKNSRYPVKAGEDMRLKNQNWLKEVHKRNYKNQKYLEKRTTKGEQILYGLEAEAISLKRLTKKLQAGMAPLLDKTEELLKRYELKILNQALKDLIIRKLT